VSKLQGTVVWYSEDKKFGFLRPDDHRPGDKDVFVHISAVEGAGLRTLDEGQRVSYLLRPDRKHADRMNVYDLELID
jgi:cold shock protein